MNGRKLKGESGKMFNVVSRGQDCLTESRKVVSDGLDGARVNGERLNGGTWKGDR